MNRANFGKQIASKTAKAPKEVAAVPDPKQRALRPGGMKKGGKVKGKC